MTHLHKARPGNKVQSTISSVSTGFSIPGELSSAEHSSALEGTGTVPMYCLSSFSISTSVQVPMYMSQLSSSQQLDLEGKSPSRLPA